MELKGGLDKEHPKLDFKRIWYDLSVNSEINEFLKDTTSIVNTVGLDGFIVIGFDDKTKEFVEATFKNSRLRDSSNIIDLINKKVDQLFDLNTFDIVVLGHKLSVIHIPPSINKPHVIRLYQSYDKEGNIRNEENKVFVRKNSRTFPASKYDFELMYYDRKNIIPDYELHSNFPSKVLSFNISDRLDLSTFLTIENTGRRSVAIRQISLTVEFGNEPTIEKMLMISDSKYTATNIIIKSGEIWNGHIDFHADTTIPFADYDMRNSKQNYYNQERPNMKHSDLSIGLANGTILKSELTRV